MSLIEVINLDQASFANKLKNWGSYTEIYEGEARFREVPMCERVANRHASSCLIVWAFNLRKRTLASGHFSDIDVQGKKTRTQRKVLDAIQSYAHDQADRVQPYSAPIHDLVYPLNFENQELETYVQFLEWLRQAQQQWRDDLEVHLFGQNHRFTPSTPRSVEHQQQVLLEVNQVTGDLLRQQIGLGQIVDHRVKNYHSTDTLFDPTDQILYVNLQKSL